MASPNSTILNIQGREKSATRTIGSQFASFDDKPLWNHVNVLKLAVTRSNRVWSCNYYSKKVIGSYSKVKAHLLKIPNQGVKGCKNISDEVRDAIMKEHEQAESLKVREVYEMKRKTEFMSLPLVPTYCNKKERKAH